MFSGKCHSKARLEGQTAVITGCNTGIGKETVLDIYRRGEQTKCTILRSTADFKPQRQAAVLGLQSAADL